MTDPTATADAQPCRLADIARASGGFGMLALDQREALRQRFAAAGHSTPVSDAVLTAFQVAAARVLTPYASAVLVDRQLSYDAVLEAHAVDPGCGLILSDDDLRPGNGIPVD